MTAGEFGDRAVLDRDLTVDQVPGSADPWTPFAEFALSFDGYQYRPAVADWANMQADHFDDAGVLANDLRLSDLRALAFFEQRRFHHFGWTPKGDDLRYIDAILREIRARLERGEVA